MSNLPSYVFYTESNGDVCLPSQLKAGVKVFRVTVTKNKITIVKKILRRVLVDGAAQLTEHFDEKRIISLHTNSHGQKYIKVFRCGDKGDIQNDWSMLIQDDLIGGNFEVSKECEECIERIICGWFDHEYECKWTAKQGKQLLFPALRRFETGLDFRDKTLRATLISLEMGTKRCFKELRNNKDWPSFVARMAKSETKVYEAASILAHKPALLHFAALNTGESFVEYYRSNPSEVEAYSSAFDIFEMKCMDLMFNHLPRMKKPFAARLVLALAQKNITQGSASQWTYVDPAPEIFALIPSGLKKGLAAAFLASLQEFYQRTEDTFATVIDTVMRNSDLKNTFAHWVWEKMSEPSLSSSSTIANVRERCVELFATDYIEFNSELLTSKNGVTFCHLLGTEKIHSTGETDVFAELSLIVDDDILNSGVVSWSGNIYPTQSGRSSRLPGRLYSTDEVITILEQGAEEIDDILRGLGRPTTPANRGAYLRYGHVSRTLKSTWRYYDLGVTTPLKVLALRRCRITSESDIATYAQLPDEMFYELIQLQSDVELDFNDLEFLVQENMEDEIPEDALAIR